MAGHFSMRVGSESDLQVCTQPVAPYRFIRVLSPPFTMFHRCTGIPVSCTNTFPSYLCRVLRSLNACFYGSQSWSTSESQWEYTQPQPTPQPNSGALPVAAPPQSLVADGDIFPMVTAVLGHQFCHPDAPLAPEEDRWQWLSGITGRYMYQLAVTMWMGKNQALDVDDSYQYPCNSRLLTMSKLVVVEGVCHRTEERTQYANGHEQRCPGRPVSDVGGSWPGDAPCWYNRPRKEHWPRFFFKDVTAPDFPDDWFDPNVYPRQ